MKRGGAGSEINSKMAKGEDIAANQNIVWRIKGGESYDFDLDVTGWQRDSDMEEGELGWGKPRLVSFGVPNLSKFQLYGSMISSPSPQIRVPARRRTLRTR